MPTLTSTDGGSPVEVDDNDVVAALRSGQVQPSATPGPDGQLRTRLVGPDGHFYSAPVAKAADYMEKKGLRLAQPADEFVHDHDVLGPLAAAAMGAGSGATIGALGPVVDAMTGGDWNRATTEQYPKTRLGSEIGTSILLSLAGGMGALKTVSSGAALAEGIESANAAKQAIGLAGTVVKTDEAASALKGVVNAGALKKSVEALKGGWGALKDVAKYTPTGALSGAVSGAQESLAGMVTKELLQKGPGLGLGTSMLAAMGKVGAAYAGPAAAEGALWGISQAVNEKALGDPTEWGELLWTDMSHQIMLGGGLGFTAGAIKGAAGRGVRSSITGVTNRLTAEIQPEGILGKGAFDELRKQTVLSSKGRLSNASLSGLEEVVGKPELHAIMRDPNLIPEGLAPDIKGGSLFLDSQGGEIKDGYDFAKRAEVAKDHYGSMVGRDGTGMNGDTPGNFKNIMSIRQNQVKDAVEAAGADIADPAIRKTLPFVQGPEVAQKIAENLKKLTPTDGIEPLMTPMRRTAMAQITRFNQMGAIDNENLYKLVSEVAPYEGKAALTAHDQGVAEAYKMVGRSLRASQLETAATKLGVDGQPLLSAGAVEQWKGANSKFSALNKLVNALAAPGVDSAPSGDVMKLLTQVNNRVAWSVSIRGSMAVRTMLQAAIAGHSMSYGAAALGTVPIAAVAGAAGAVALKGLLPSIMPSAERMGEIAYKAATYKQWGNAIETLDAHAASLVQQWVKNPGLLSRGASIVGDQVLIKMGGDKDPNESIRKLQRRYASITAQPQSFAANSQAVSAHMQGIAPTAALSTSQGYGRAVMISHAIVQQLNTPQRTMGFQPSLDMQKPFSAQDRSRVGRQLAAVWMPKETFQAMLAGTASDEQIQTLKYAHPEYFMRGTRHLATAVLQMDKHLNAYQTTVLGRMGYHDNASASNIPGLMPSAPQAPGMMSRQLRMGQQQQQSQGAVAAARPVSSYQHLRPTSGGADLGHNPAAKPVV